MSTILQRSTYLHNSGWRYDIRFDVGLDGRSRIFQGHSVLIAAASPLFDAILHNCVPRNNVVYRISDVDPDAFEALLQFMYTDNTNIGTVEDALKIGYAARKYGVNLLVRRCIQFVHKDLSASNACKAFEFARFFALERLANKCLRIFSNHTQAVFRSHYFLEASSETVHTILTLGEMNTPSERDVFNAVLAWTKRRCERKEVHQSPANLHRELTKVGFLFHVRYLTMTATGFTESVVTSGIFSSEESLAILTNITVPGSTVFPASIRDLLQVLHRRNRCREKFYCHLINFDGPQRMMTHVALEPFTAQFSLLARANVLLLGVVFTAQFLRGRDDDVDQYHTESDYMEDALLQICNQDGAPLEERTLSERVCWEENVELRFEAPFTMRKETRYFLGILFRTRGSYRKYTDLVLDLEMDDIRITAATNNDHIVAVHSIIVGKPNVP